MLLNSVFFFYGVPVVFVHVAVAKWENRTNSKRYMVKLSAEQGAR